LSVTLGVLLFWEQEEHDVLQKSDILQERLLWKI